MYQDISFAEKYKSESELLLIRPSLKKATATL